jgi:uncharacterized membrane protein
MALIINNRWLGGFLGFVFLGIQDIVKSVIVNNKYLSVFGFNYPYLTTLDYYPVIPWAGVFFLGFFVGGFLVKWKSEKLKNRFAEIICFIGRHALKIYFMHIIVLFGFFWVLSIFI